MKRWYLYLILVFLVMVLVASSTVFKWNSSIDVAEVWNLIHQPKKKSEPAREPEGNAVLLEVLELRQRHHLRPLTEVEHGSKIQNLPRGTYGFSMCDLASLSRRRDGASLLEIHKHLDGIVYYVGYASKDDVEKYLARRNNFHILTSPDRGDRTSLLFEIPVDFVSKCEVRPFKEGYVFDLFVVAIPELYS